MDRLESKITPDMLVPMDVFELAHPVRINLAYARDDNLLLGERIYRQDARLWLHRDLSEIVLRAAKIIADQHGFTCVLYDGLRTFDAQDAMLRTKRVRDNPHWLKEPRLLSPPGTGAHPRGMAIDIALEDESGALLDMGTPFDDLTEKAHRDYAHNETVQKNRAILTDAMMETARMLGKPLLPLPQEWWDFRFPAEIYGQYAPLSDKDLPPEMRMMDQI